MSKRLRDVAEVHYGKSPNEVLTEDSPIPIIGTGGIYGRASRAMYNGPAVVVPRKGSLGNPQYVGQPFWPVDTTYAVIPKAGVDAKWLYYSLDAFDLTKLNEATGVPSISRDWLYKVLVGSEEYGEQRRIAEILSTVDESIEQTEALIAKYQQIKAGLMHDLFTRGVTPDGHLRPHPRQAPHLYKGSPLGWIPKEWRTELLDRLAQRGSGHTPNKNHPEFWNGGIKWISLADSWRLDRVYIAETDNEISQQGIESSSAVLHPSGIVVLSRDAGVGKSAITTCSMAVSQHFMCWRCGPELDKYFLYYWLQYRKREFENIATGSTIPTIGLRYFKHYRINAPLDPDEQKYISSSLLTLDNTIFALEGDVQKLRNQKHGLMHDLLTGRVRVKVEESRGDTI